MHTDERAAFADDAASIRTRPTREQRTGLAWLALPFSQPSFLAGVQELRSVRRTVKGSVNNFVHCRDYNMDGWRDNYWRPFESNCFLH